MPKELVVAVEQDEIKHLDFFQWLCLTSYYGKAMLQIPFVIHALEFPVAQEYFMYLRNGESVQYSAKKAKRMLIKEFKENL